MYQIDNSTAIAVQPTPSAAGTAGFFSDGNPATGAAPTIVPAEFLNTVMMELLGVLAAANVTPSKSSYTQLATSIKAIIQAGGSGYAADTGSANTYAVTYVPPVAALTDGMVLRFKAKTANTGACTFSPNGLSAAPIVGSAHSALQGGEIVPTGDVWVQWNSSIGSSGSWVLIDSTGGAVQVAAASKSQHAPSAAQVQNGNLAYATGSGAANAYTASYAPAITALTDGLTLHSTAIAANTGASTFAPNGLTAKPILSLGQVALQGGEFVANSRFSVRYSLTLDSWILLSASGGNAMSGRLINVQVFTASGTYTPTPGTLTAVVDCQGGGGGGGGCQVTAASQYAAGGGGGGGSLARGRFTLSQLGSSVAVGIGTAGAGGIGNANGSVGGTTTFGSLLSAPGGRGGAPGLAVASTAQIVVAGGSASGAATGGNVFNTGGTPGGVGMTYLTSASSGNGGGSPITGGGGGGAAVGLTSAGQAATAPGAGGGGPASGPSIAAQNGGAGGAGMVIVWEYA